MVQTNQAWRVEPFIMIEVSWISIISSPWFYIRKNTVQLIITGLDLVLPLQAWLDGPSCSLFFGTERQPGKFDGWHSVSLTKKSTLWQTFTSLWKITMFNGKTHYKWSFSIAMLNYHKVYISKIGGKYTPFLHDLLCSRRIFDIFPICDRYFSVISMFKSPGFQPISRSERLWTSWRSMTWCIAMWSPTLSPAQRRWFS